LLLLRKKYNLQEELEVTKGVIKIRNSKKDIHHNGQMKKDKRTNNDLPNITHKTKDRETQVSSISFYLLVLWLYTEIEVTRRKFYGHNQDLIYQLRNICVTDEHGYVPFIVSTTPSIFSLSHDLSPDF